MSPTRQNLSESRELLLGISKYTEVLEGQLEGLRATLAEAVEHVMAGIVELSAITGKEAKAADSILEQTYLDPQADTLEFMSTIQVSVDHLLEGLSHSEQGEQVSDDQRLVDDKLRRFAGQFSKHMEALSTMDSAVAGLLFKVMAALSSDDVIGQRLEHVQSALHGLEVALIYILLDFQGRFTAGNIQKLKDDLLRFTYSEYTMEEEKQLFKSIFGEVPPVST